MMGFLGSLSWLFCYIPGVAILLYVVAEYILSHGKPAATLKK